MKASVSIPARFPGRLDKYDLYANAYKLLSVLNVFLMDHFNLPRVFSVTCNGSLHMELDSVSFPPQRSHCNELPVPPLLVMFPAAQSHHKHVTIMLATRLYPTAHLAVRAESQTLVEMREGAVHLLCMLRACVCVCVRELIVEGVMRG